MPTSESLALAGRTAVVTGGTNGIGAATAMLLRRQGARVIVIGRSQQKADALVVASAALDGPGSIEAIVEDLGLMVNVRAAVEEVAARVDGVDLLIHGVGVFLTRPEHTTEGIEKDLAVSYLSRFVFLEAAHERGLVGSRTRMVNIAASAAKMPDRAKTEFGDLAVVRSRSGFASHSQAQTANDLLTIQAGRRYGIAALGFGPGNTDTGILRDLPWTTRALFFPFTRNKRRPEAVAEQLVALLADDRWSTTTAGFAGRKGRFQPDPFLLDVRRQREVIAMSEALAHQALGDSTARTGS